MLTIRLAHKKENKYTVALQTPLQTDAPHLSKARCTSVPTVMYFKHK